tara:strand:- start:325 stop:570 length:246 start_codon:yes stop_codon:yes gene_type:complete
MVGLRIYICFLQLLAFFNSSFIKDSPFLLRNCGDKEKILCEAAGYVFFFQKHLVAGVELAHEAERLLWGQFAHLLRRVFSA